MKGYLMLNMSLVNLLIHYFIYTAQSMRFFQ